MAWMPRRLVLLLGLLSCSSPASAPPPSPGPPASSPDQGPPDLGDAGAMQSPDLGPEDLGAPVDQGSKDTGPSPDLGAADQGSAPDLGPAPVDCSQVQAQPNWTLCDQRPDTCEVKFTDGAGCQQVCAQLGLMCAQVYEDVDGACAPDTARPALGCAPASGHTSDYCVCTATGVCEDCPTEPVEDCGSYPFSAQTLLAERAGFGAQTTGGDPNNVYRVTTLSGSGQGSLRAALQSAQAYWIVFDVNGTITHNTPVEIASNKTIDGRGRDITIEGTLLIDDARNIIISDVTVTNPLEGFCTQAGDVIRAQGTGGAPDSYTTRDLWIHHVHAHTGGDGLIDLRGASRVTLSWSHLANHKKAMLMWQNIDGQPATGMRVTLHHNYFDRLTIRGPQFVYGWAHYYNNYQYQWYEYGAASLGGAQFYSEANVYEARPDNVCVPACPDPNPCGDNDFVVSKLALVNDWAENGAGNVQSVGDLLLNDAEIQLNNPQAVFTPSSQYSYTAEPASMSLASRVAAQAGPRTTYCQSP